MVVNVAEQVIPVVAKELREKATLGANILKTGTDPPILDDRFVWPLPYLSF